MSGLLGMLDLGAGAYLAYSAGVATTGRNLANVGTEGYSRESIDLRAQIGAPRVGGVEALGPVRAHSSLLATRERGSHAAHGQADALAAGMLDAEAQLAPQGAPDVVDSIAALFAGLAAASAAPLDPSLRAAAIDGADRVATGFQRAARAISDAQRGADLRLREMAAEASALAAEVAAANEGYAVSGDPVLADRRDLAARRLAELTGAEARLDPDGMMRVTIDGGVSVVDGVRASRFEATPDAALGDHLRLDVVDGGHRDDVTARLRGGRMGGELALRDGALATTAAEIDQLAYDLATSVNAVHAAHAGLDGGTGRDLFVAPAGATGAAAAMAVDPAIAADPRLLAGAAVGAPAGDNHGLLALAALADANVAGGGARTLAQESIRTLAAFGAQAQRAVAGRELEEARLDVVAAARDELAGVSIEEEMARLTELQRAAEASTRFIATVDQMLTDLLERI